MHAHSKLAVAGATGRLGRHVVEVLEERGHHVVRVSRADRVDIVTGQGLDKALAGVECVVDAASGPSPDRDEATAFFTAAARNLHEVGRRAGVQQLIVVSIIGTDRFAAGYGAAKLAHEEASLAGPVPTRIVRAAEFHEFVGQLVEWGTQGDVSYIQEMRTQPVAARAVAELLADLATGPSPASPAEPFVEIAGPREERLVDLAARLVARRGSGPTIQAVHDPNDPNQAVYDDGGLLPGPDAVLAGPTFVAWLDGQRVGGSTMPSVG